MIPRKLPPPEERCVAIEIHERDCYHRGADRTRVRWIDGCAGSFCDPCLFSLPHYKHLSFGGAVELTRVDSDGIPLDPAARSFVEVMCNALLREPRP